jgi:hypothetical protein
VVVEGVQSLISILVDPDQFQEGGVVEGGCVDRSVSMDLVQTPYEAIVQDVFAVLQIAFDDRRQVQVNGEYSDQVVFVVEGRIEVASLVYALHQVPSVYVHPHRSRMT